MGVSRTDFIVYGYKLPFYLKKDGVEIDFWDDKYRPYIEGHPGVDFTIVRDGMDGGYTVVGQMIGISSDDFYTGWDFVNLDINKLNPEYVKSKYREIFEMEPDEPMGEPYLFIFSHFS